MKRRIANKPRQPINTWLCIAVIAGVCMAVFAYTFKPALDMNGDTSQYYIYATSLAQGHGYTQLETLGHPPSNGFPPGYPLLMAPVRMMTDSIIAQKILNGFMLFGAAALLFLFLRRVAAQPLALAAVLVTLLNYRVLQFATIMMSETAYLLFSALAIYLLYLFDTSEEKRIWWKNPYFYLLILVAGYSYMIRTQGITLIVGIAAWMLFARKWWQTGGGLYSRVHPNDPAVDYPQPPGGVGRKPLPRSSIGGRCVAARQRVRHFRSDDRTRVEHPANAHHQGYPEHSNPVPEGRLREPLYMG